MQGKPCAIAMFVLKMQIRFLKYKKIDMFAAMKNAARFFLVLFVLFTAMPVIVSAATPSGNSIDFTIIEEELQKEVEFSCQIILFKAPTLAQSSIKKNTPFTEQFNWKNIPRGVVSLPPEL